MREGICVAGNMIVDILYPVEGLPRPGELTTILDGIARSSGGALCNTIIDFAKLDPALPLMALGRLGTDGEGDFVLEKLKEYPNIDLTHIIREGITSFTSVMADVREKQRTFYHYRGANALFSEDDIDWEAVPSAFLHVGYVLLLDALDEADAEYGTKLARMLCHAQSRGIKTSIDVVSEAGLRFKKLVPPAMKYADYCIINELEAEQSTGVALRAESGALLAGNMRGALERMKELGVAEWAVIHCPEGGYGMDSSGRYEEVESLRLPEDYIKGTVGAGDAFCVGVLYEAYKGGSMRQGIELGTAVAACSLSENGATEGVRRREEALLLYHKMRGEA